MGGLIMDLKFEGVQSTEETLDPRDLTIASFVLGKDDIPEEGFMLAMPKDIELIRDQGQWSSCVGHAFTMALSILNYINTNKWIWFDPYVLYGTRTSNYKGLGMFLDDALSTLYHEGAYLKRHFGEEGDPMDIITKVSDFKKNHPEYVKEAKLFTISGYARVKTVYDIKAALKMNMPVVASFPVYKTLLNPKDGHVEIFDKAHDYCQGYHCMCIVGWTKNNEWIVVNSWGTENGMQGLYFIPFGYKISEAYNISDSVFPLKNKLDSFTINFITNKCMYDNKGETVIKSMPCDVLIDSNAKNRLNPLNIYVHAGVAAECMGCIVTDNTTEIVFESEESVYILNALKCRRLSNGQPLVPILEILDQFNYEYDIVNPTVEVRKK